MSAHPSARRRRILANPRYTGRQVQRWNLPEGWVISRKPAHPALPAAGKLTRQRARRAVPPSGKPCADGHAGW